jgi:hypothetical protein
MKRELVLLRFEDIAEGHCLIYSESEVVSFYIVDGEVVKESSAVDWEGDIPFAKKDCRLVYIIPTSSQMYAYYVDFDWFAIFTKADILNLSKTNKNYVFAVVEWEEYMSSYGDRENPPEYDVKFNLVGTLDIDKALETCLLKG